MCGICGIVNFNNTLVQVDHLKIMMETMRHRGPDDDGLFITGNSGQGFVRLSIIDLSQAGHQPMFSKDGNYSIVYNGEVYNYLELKKELSFKYDFSSKTDTEVVLYAYIEWGIACLDRLNGMFAFTIYDRANKRLFGARDRFGIKPFYYSINNERLIYASDIPPLLKLLKNKPTTNNIVVFNYLSANRTNYSEDTFFNEVRKLQHGHYFILEGNDLIITRWYDLTDKSEVQGFVDSNEYFQYFSDSIKLQLRSDVPIGTCLSGGLDSSSITTVLYKDFGLKDMHTFSAIYDKGDVGDEQEYIKSFKNELNNLHFITPTGYGLFKDLHNFIIALSEPISGTSEYAEFKVMELAKKYCTVILNGQGADEVLGGYNYFYGAQLYDLFMKNKDLTLIKELISYYKLHKNNEALKYFAFFLLSGKMQSKLLFKNKKIINPDFYNHYCESQDNIVKRFYNFKSIKDFYINHFEYKFEHHLLWADKSGMFFSLETRFPFLDHRLVEKSLATADNKILNSGWTKLILRDAMKGRLQDSIRLRKDKVGYETPEDKWFRQPFFKDIFNSLIYSNSFKNRPYFNKEAIIKMIKDHMSCKADHSTELWKVLHLELWLREYID